MTTWDKIVARIVEGLEKITGALAGQWAWVEGKGRCVSLLVRRQEKRKEVERAYARLGRLMEEMDRREAADAPPNPDIQEARRAAAELRRELEELERQIGAHT